MQMFLSGEYVKVSPKQLEVRREINLGRMLACAIVLGLTTTLGACSSTGTWQAEAQAAGASTDGGQASVNPELVRRLQEAEKRVQQALSAGQDVEMAVAPYRKLVKAYPQSKEPWVQIAQSYFDAHRYGEAIVAAGEVQKRDANDQVALSIAAVSGLRVATESLSVLKDKGGNLGKAMSRSDADRIVRLLRGTTGESVLVPRPDTDTPTTSRAVTRRAAAQRGPAAKPSVSNANPSSVPPARNSNPFLKLN